jgi:hypothetical protein
MENNLDSLNGVKLIRAYRDLAVKNGHKDPFQCPKCQFTLFPNLDDLDRSYLYCVGCDYKQYPGSAALSVLRRALQLDT